MFVARDYELSNRIKFHNYVVGKFGRKDLLRKFCADNGIDYKKNGKNYKYCFPERYLIEHRELNYLSGIRDKLILSFYDDYRDAQNDNLGLQEQLKHEIDSQDNLIEVCKTRLARSRALQKRAKTPIDQIHYENVIESLKTRIKNERIEKNRLQNRLKMEESQFRNNIRNWNKQIDVIEMVLDYSRKGFEKNISKKIRKRFDFTDFYSSFDDYSDEVKKVLKGELHE